MMLLTFLLAMETGSCRHVTPLVFSPRNKAANSAAFFGMLSCLLISSAKICVISEHRSASAKTKTKRKRSPYHWCRRLHLLLPYQLFTFRSPFHLSPARCLKWPPDIFSRAMLSGLSARRKIALSVIRAGRRAGLQPPTPTVSVWHFRHFVIKSLNRIYQQNS